MLIFFPIVINITVYLAIDFKNFQWGLDENKNLAMNYVSKFCFHL